MQRTINNSFVTCQGPHCCQGVHPAWVAVVHHGSAPWQPHSAPSTFPRAVGAMWGLMVSNCPQIVWAPGKKARICQWLEPPVWEWDVFSQGAFSKASKQNHLWWGEEGWRTSHPRVCAEAVGKVLHTFVHGVEGRCKRPHSNPHGSYMRGFIHPSKTRNEMNSDYPHPLNPFLHLLLPFYM